jgi:hypothetical protein
MSLAGLGMVPVVGGVPRTVMMAAKGGKKAKKGKQDEAYERNRPRACG